MVEMESHLEATTNFVGWRCEHLVQEGKVELRSGFVGSEAVVVAISHSDARSASAKGNMAQSVQLPVLTLPPLGFRAQTFRNDICGLTVNKIQPSAVTA